MKTVERLSAVDASAQRLGDGIPDLPLQDMQLMRLIRVTSLGINACVEPLLRPEGLTESSFHTLVIVMSGDLRDGISPGALCEQVGQTRANMTRILDVLTSQKRVVIEADQHDGRRRRVRITPLGRQLVRKCTKKLAPTIGVAMSGLTEADKPKLERLLRGLILSMDAAERLAP